MWRSGKIAAFGGLALLFTLVTTGGALATMAHRAVAEGAFEEPATGCLHKTDAALRSGDLRAADRILARDIAGHYLTADEQATSWHAKQLAAWLGLRIGFSSSERAGLAREMGRLIPDCSPRP
jgi:hypothetical protein